MEMRSLEYLVPPEMEAEALIQALRSGTRARVGTPLTIDRTFLDTFDWRIHRAGGRIELFNATDEPRLAWRRLSTGRALGEVATSAWRFVWDLPSGPFRDRLEPILEMRALLPRVRVLSHLVPIEFLNGNQKTVARAFLEEHRAGEPGEVETRPLARRARVAPVRGYRKARNQIVRSLAEGLGLRSVEEDLSVEAFAAVGLTPGDYSSKVRVALEPEMPALEAMRDIFRNLLGTLLANWEGTVQDVDSEFLHDFRVAVRRTRSALGQVKGVLPQSVVDRFQPEFKWLGAITGPTRDMDVYLLNFPRYEERLPAGIRPHLAPLGSLLRARQQVEHRKLVRHLRSRRYRELVRSWQTFLKRGEDDGSPGPYAGSPVVEVADKRVWKVFRRTIREGEAIGASSPPERLHELRKTCKKLRYLLEFFQSLYPPDEIGPLIRALKSLQDNLGEYQDLQVHAEALHGFGRELDQNDAASERALAALELLVESFVRREREVREEFAERFAGFSRAKNRKQFRRLFRPDGKEERAGR